MRAPARITLAVLLAIAPAAAYYHYNHFPNRFGPAIQEKFDLNALPNKTVSFFVTDSATLIYPGNDSFASVLSQIRQAAATWNGVGTSDLRVAFGGLYTSGTPQNTPGGTIVFEDIPPGVVALTSHTVGDPVLGPNGLFVPITQATIHLNRNLTQSPGPSYQEVFFTTVVHEMGHALGLQHTFTSSAMSTGVTRSTSRARPLDADDIAGISLLYPTRAFAGSFGSITGRVTSGGQPIHMASVVALRPSGAAVSTLTNPDGSYRIDGLPQDVYWIYVHALPPGSDIQLPLDGSNQTIPADGPIETLFYPGTLNPQQFTPIPVTRGAVVAGIDFSVQRRSAVPIYDVYTYGVAGGNYISPAYVNTVGAQGLLMLGGNGLMSGGRAVSGLNVQVLGGFASVRQENIRPWGTALALYLDFPPFPGIGLRHILLTVGNDAWVLPAGLILAQKSPPAVNQAVPNPDGSLTILGSNMGPESRVYFDGIPATVRTPFTGTDQFGLIVVNPPPGASGQVATLNVVNSDGQNSLSVQPQNPPVYRYGFTEQPAISVQPNILPAGITAMVEVTGVNTRFTEGSTTVGFGTTDIVVRNIWVLSSTRLLANIIVSPAAPGGVLLPVTVISGFQATSQPFAFAVQPLNPRLPAITMPLVNANPNQTGIYPGAVVNVYGSNLALGPTGATITLNDQPAQILSASGSQITFSVPAALTPGPAVLRLNNGSDSAYPVVVQVDSVPAGVVSTDAPIGDARAGDGQ